MHVCCCLRALACMRQLTGSAGAGCTHRVFVRVWALHSSFPALLPAQDPACANLADWYEAYAAVYAPGPGPASTGKKRKAAVKGGKGKGKRKVDAEAEGAEEGGAGASGSGGAAGAPKDEAAALQRELAARFSQATADLQYVGLIKPAKRRRGDYVQRWVAGVWKEWRLAGAGLMRSRDQGISGMQGAAERLASGLRSSGNCA